MATIIFSAEATPLRLPYLLPFYPVFSVSNISATSIAPRIVRSTFENRPKLKAESKRMLLVKW
jgi:hypothetical protein